MHNTHFELIEIIACPCAIIIIAYPFFVHTFSSSHGYSFHIQYVCSSDNHNNYKQKEKRKKKKQWEEENETAKLFYGSVSMLDKVMPHK